MSAFFPKILIIDDFAENLKLLGNSLKKENFTILTALSGKQGLALVENKKPDLILLDVMMPEMDGFEVCDRLKNNELTADIPVIFVTALNQLENIKNGLEIGAADFVTKPFKINELLVKINHQLRIQRKLKFNTQMLKIIQLILSFNINEKNTKLISKTNGSIFEPDVSIDQSTLNFIIQNVDYFYFENSVFTIKELQDHFINTYGVDLVFSEANSILTDNKFSGFTFLKFVYDLFFKTIHKEGLAVINSSLSLQKINIEIELLRMEMVFTKLDALHSKILDQIVYPKDQDITDINVLLFRKLCGVIEMDLSLLKSDSSSTIVIEFPIYKKVKYNKNVNLELNLSSTKQLPKVLIVEDNQLNIEYLSALLQEQKLEFDLAYTGNEAIEKVKTETYQIIFMDVHLPGMTGIEVTKILRDKFQYKGSIISISGSIDEATIETCRQSGFNDFLTKPFSAIDLDKIIRKYLHAPIKVTKVDFNQENGDSAEYSYSKALEIANGDGQLLKTWLLNFCDVLNKASEIASELKSTLLYKGGEKVFHDLINYAGYFQIDEIISAVQELKRLNEQDPDYRIQLKALLTILESEIKLANTFYQKALLNLD